MKTVVSGVALAAMLALAAPAWAQGTDAQQQPNANAPQTSVSPTHAKKAHATKGMHARRHSHKNNRHVAMRHRGGHHYAAHTRPMHRTTVARTGGTSPNDHMANQLNRAENQRLSGGSTPPMTGSNMAPQGNTMNGGNMNAGNPNMAPTGAPNQPQPIQGQ